MDIDYEGVNDPFTRTYFFVRQYYMDSSVH